jgi:hypothetical protein
MNTQLDNAIETLRKTGRVAALDAVLEERERLRTALDWYSRAGAGMAPPSEVREDGGRRAREALRAEIETLPSPNTGEPK